MYLRCLRPHSLLGFATGPLGPPKSGLCLVSNASCLAKKLGFCQTAAGCCPGQSLYLPSGSSCSWPLQGPCPLCSSGPCPRVTENLHEKVLLTAWNSSIPIFLASPLSCHFPPSLRAQGKSISTQKTLFLGNGFDWRRLFHLL